MNQEQLVLLEIIRVPAVENHKSNIYLYPDKKPASQQVFIFQYNNFSIRFFSKATRSDGLLYHFQILKLKKTLIHKIRKRHFQIRFSFHRSFNRKNSTFISCPATSGNSVVDVPEKHRF